MRYKNITQKASNKRAISIVQSIIAISDMFIKFDRLSCTIWTKRFATYAIDKSVLCTIIGRLNLNCVLKVRLYNRYGWRYGSGAMPVRGAFRAALPPARVTCCIWLITTRFTAVTIPDYQNGYFAIIRLTPFSNIVSYVTDTLQSTANYACWQTFYTSEYNRKFQITIWYNHATN